MDEILEPLDRYLDVAFREAGGCTVHCVASGGGGWPRVYRVDDAEGRPIARIGFTYEFLTEADRRRQFDVVAYLTGLDLGGAVRAITTSDLDAERAMPPSRSAVV